MPLPRRVSLPGLLALALLAAAGAQADTRPPADATVFWSETAPQPRPFVAGASVIRAGQGLGGAAPAVQSVVSGATRVKGPNGLEVLDGRLWWPDQLLNRLSTSLPDGSNRAAVDAGNPYDLDIEAGTLYWTALNSNTLYKVADPLGLAPSSEVLLSGLSSPSAVDAAGGYLYWSEVAGTDRLRRSQLDGSNPVTLLSNIQSYDFKVTAQHIYLSTTFGEVVRSNLDGSGRVTLASNIGFLTGIDVAGAAIYLSSLNGQILAMDLNGQNLTTLYTAPAGSQIRGVAVLSAVPEPGQAAMLLAGPALLGLSPGSSGWHCRRQRRCSG